MQNVFIYREYLISRNGLIRIDNECIFDSFEKAKRYLKEEVRDKIEPQFRFSIIKYPLNEKEPWSLVEEWLFLSDGSSLRHIYPNQELVEILNHGKFSIGDIVKIKSEIENPLHGLTFEDTGVVYQLPNEEDPTYIIVFISENGCVSHLHLAEDALSNETVLVSEENQFLHVISRHLKNGSIDVIKEEVWNGVFVKKIEKSYYH